MLYNKKYVNRAYTMADTINECLHRVFVGFIRQTREIFVYNTAFISHLLNQKTDSRFN